MKSVMKKVFTAVFSLCLIALTVCLIIFPETSISACRAATELCLDSVIPALFPFLVCSGLFIALGLAGYAGRYLSAVMRPLFGVPGAGAAALILGLVSGYPNGAVCAASLFSSGECTKTEAERLCAFCNNSGPLFIMGVVACGILKTPQVGKYLYLSHVLSALITGLCFKFYKHRHTETHTLLPPSASIYHRSSASALGTVIDNSIMTMLKVCSYIVLFSTAAAFLPAGKLRPFIHSFLEISGGMSALAKTVSDPTLLLPLVSFFLAFSGISVIFQVYSVISPCGLSVIPYIFGKLFQGVISFLITYLTVLYRPETVDVFSHMPQIAHSITAASPYAIFVTAFLSCGAGGVALLAAARLAKGLFNRS